jgi:DNA-binding CsgD family transcriptional regulator
LIEAAGGTAALSREARIAVLAAFDAAADAALQEDRGHDVIRLSEETTAIAAPLDEETRLAVGLRGAFELRAVGLTQRAITRYRDAWETARRQMLPTSMVEAGHGLARALRDVGHLDEARAVALESVELQSRLGSLSPRWGTALAILHSIELSLGEPDALARLRKDAEIGHDPHFAIGLHQMIAAQLARREGAQRAKEVEQELAAARDAWSGARCPRCRRELSIVSAELLARIGRPEDARRELADWEAGLVGPDYAMRRLWHARARAAIALAEGRPQAASALAELAAAFERFDLVEDAIWAYLDLGAALARSDDRARAREAYGHAVALADGTGAVDLSRLATRGLRRLGIRAWRRGRTGGASEGLEALSRREQEVARLVASGASNREIADTLVVSPKTVERHLTNILAKVGARNRTDLARLVHAASAAGAGSGTGFPR